MGTLVVFLFKKTTDIDFFAIDEDFKAPKTKEILGNTARNSEKLRPELEDTQINFASRSVVKLSFGTNQFQILPEFNGHQSGTSVYSLMSHSSLATNLFCAQ